MGAFSVGLVSHLFRQRIHPSGSRFGDRHEGLSPGLTGACFPGDSLRGEDPAFYEFLVSERMDFPMPMAFGLG